MTAIVDDWYCTQCHRYLPFGGICIKCRDRAEAEAIRDWINDHG